MMTHDSKHPPNNIITELSYKTHINQKFKLTCFSQSFIIEKLESDAAMNIFPSNGCAYIAFTYIDD